MAIKLTKDQKINNISYPAGTIFVGLSPAEEERLRQGGDAEGADLGTPNPAGPAPLFEGVPDPRQAAGVSAQVVLPGAVSQHIATGIGGRTIVAGSGATNANAAISVVSGGGRRTDAIQGAADAVGLRFADLAAPMQPLLVSTGSGAVAIVVEVL